jgi:nucleotide-binding universal stress UspA family protein
MPVSTDDAAEPGPILFAYDGSDLAGNAIAEAGRQLRPGREALILTIWEPFNVGFLPAGGMGFDAAGADEVRTAAEETASRGASLAEAAGFRAKSMTAEAAPTSKGIIDAAEACDASLIVLGSHGRSGVASLMVGSVAGAVAAHSRRSVLIVHRRR